MKEVNRPDAVAVTISVLNTAVYRESASWATWPGSFSTRSRARRR